ncbi:hypothetical protein F8M41_009324 [Gigaspora margarita]|uniref:Uncharacterized protein n=1 Tax=Gigaspora margarita TaxID=4874 RepID=A0A8H4B4F5_GIGMA|nr:hypothetical protein F8M41_009324 [Gigaspora margarita]
MVSKYSQFIEQELEAINPFIQGLYQLHNVNYPQARLIIQQPTVNANIAACTIVHSTAIMQEQCVQIWYINKIDMFSRANNECVQFICKEQCRFRKEGQEEDELLGDTVFSCNNAHERYFKSWPELSLIWAKNCNFTPVHYYTKIQ